MKRRVHFVYCGIYCVLAALGCLADFGLLPGSVAGAPFVYFTSLSNMACGIFMFAAMIRNLQKREIGTLARMKFVLVIMILVTAIVYRWILSVYGVQVSYFATLQNGLYHLILPAMFVLDWLVFYERGSAKLWDPVVETVIAFLYAAYILVRGALIRAWGISNTVVYPYFFLNPDQLGWKDQILWMCWMLMGHLILGCSLLALDRIFRKRK